MRSGAPRLVVCALVGALPATALAGATAKVTIESEPPNAKVYLDAIEDGVKCEPTPCSFDAPLGQSSAIVVLEGYEPEIVQLDVKRRGKLTYKSRLKRAMGSLRIDGARGVAIEVKDAGDGSVKGTGNVPHTFDLPAGQYTVVFSQNGKAFDTEPADIEKDQEFQLTAKPPITASKPEKTEDPDPGEDDLGDGGGKKIVITKPAQPKQPRTRIFSLGALFDVGARKFSYSGGNGQYPDFPYTATHMAGAELSLWPLALFGSRALPGLSLYARAEVSVIVAPVSGDMVMDTNTQWRSFEVSARYRHVFGKVPVEVSGGYVRDQLQFTGSQTDILPDIDYSVVRIGAKVGYLAGAMEPYAAIEGRFVLSGGDGFTSRFDGGASGEGVHGAAGLALRLGGFVARAEAAVTDYSWNFNYSSASMVARPTGGEDLITQFVIVAGFQY